MQKLLTGHKNSAMIRSLMAIIVSIMLFACSPKSITGIYSSHVKDGVLMAGYTYDFHPDGTFDMKFWSDDISSNRQGRGIYSIDKGNLLLTYGDFEPVTSSYTVRSFPSDDNNLSALNFTIYDHDGTALGGVNIIIRDTGGEMVAKGITNISGSSVIRVPQTDIPKIIDISYTGRDKLSIPLPDAGSKSFEIMLSNKTRYVPNGKKRSYRYRVKGDYLKLKEGKRTLVLKRRTP